MERLASTKEILADHLHQKVIEVYKSHFTACDEALECKITGILLERSVEHIYQLLSNDEILKSNIRLALDSIACGRKPTLQVSNRQSDFQAGLQGLVKIKNKDEIAQQIFDKVYQLAPELAPRITGMLMELQNEELITLLQDPSKLESIVERSKNCLEIAQVEVQILRSRDFSHVIYQHAHSLYPDHAPKITGMILEMDEDLLRQTVEDTKCLEKAIAKSYKVLQEELPP